MYPEISVYGLQSGNFCIRFVSEYVWTLVSEIFVDADVTVSEPVSSARVFTKWRRANELSLFFFCFSVDAGMFCGAFYVNFRDLQGHTC